MTTIVTRAGKGSALTHNEVDSNFTNLNSAKYESGNNATFGTIGGTTITASTGFSGALNGTVGASTPAAGTFTNLAYTGTLTGGTGVVNLGSGQVYKDASGNVGIGTTSPSTRLNVVGADGVVARFKGATGPTLKIESYGSNNEVLSEGGTLLAGTTNGTFQFYTGTGTPLERMRIDSSGNVGIGTTSPSMKADIVGASGTNRGLIIKASSDNGAYLQLTDTGSHEYYVGTPNNDSALVFGKDRNIANDGSELMRIDSAGNVGIGTSSPLTRLHVVGATNTGSGILVSNGGTNIAVLANEATWLGTGSSNNAVVSSFGATSLLLGTNGAERMRIDSSGNVLVNTTSTRDSSNFRVVDSEGNDFAVNTSSGGNRFVSSSSIYNKTTANAANMYVNSSGVGYAIVRSTSSIKYKTDVQDAVHGLNKVMELRPVTYKGINDGDTVFGGLIAEEVHEAGLTEFVQYAEDGSPDALAYGQMVSLAFKAIQELSAKVDTLQAELNTLKGN